MTRLQRPLTSIGLAPPIAGPLSGCAVVTVAGAAAAAVIAVGGAVVSSGVEVNGMVIEKTVDAVTPDAEAT